MEEIKFKIHWLVYFLLASSMFQITTICWPGLKEGKLFYFFNQKRNKKVKVLLLGRKKNKKITLSKTFKYARQVTYS